MNAITLQEITACLMLARLPARRAALTALLRSGRGIPSEYIDFVSMVWGTDRNL